MTAVNFEVKRQRFTNGNSCLRQIILLPVLRFGPESDAGRNLDL